MTRSFALALGLASTFLAGSAGCVSEVSSYGKVPYEHALTERKLDSVEQGVLSSNGFVLSTIEPISFHQGYAALYQAHQPVYFSADAVLHALHSSFDSILAEVESEVLARELGSALDGLRGALAKNTAAPPKARADLDVYLTVAKSLLEGKQQTPSAGGDPVKAGQLVAAAQEAKEPLHAGLFGRRDPYDFSMMKPRGHYTRSAQLSQYFRAMMWLGTVDFRLAHRSQDGEWHVDRDAVRAAALLNESATPEVMTAWRMIDAATEAFVGPADSMSLPGLSRALAGLGGGKANLDGRSDADLLGALLPESSQRIRGGLIHGGEQALSFLLLGQRFVYDSAVFTRVTYDSIPSKRLMPSPLDIAAAVFKNPIAETLLAVELDAYNYREQLHAAAREGDSLGPAVWEGSVYHGWLRALSKLSPDPVRDRPLPAVFRSEAWQKRMLSSQLASWAELRHDTVLYAKQSFTSMLGCDYPDGYVDPYPEFFAEIEGLATRSRALVSGLPFGQKAALQGRILHYFDHLATVAKRLGDMAARERANQPLTEADVEYLKGAVSMRAENHVCTTVFVPEGWHAELYYDRDEIMKREPIVADVHTQPTDERGDPVGRVLHVGTGHPRQITIVIQTDTGKRTYRGLVGTYHEVVTSGFMRYNDSEWQKKLSSDPPEDPAWLSGLIVRGALPVKRQ